MEKLDKEKVKEILGDLECAKELKCTEGGLEKLCKARSIGSDEFMICLEKATECSFKVPFGQGYLCKCPVRIHIYKEFGK